MLKIKRPEQCPKAILTIIGDDIPELPAIFGEAEVQLTEKETEAWKNPQPEAWGRINPANSKNQKEATFEPASIKDTLGDIVKGLVEKERQKEQPEERKRKGVRNPKRAIPLTTPAGVYGILPGETIELSFTFINGGYHSYHENFHFEGKFNEQACRVFNPVKVLMPKTESMGICEVKVQLQATELAQISDHVVDFTVTNG